MTRGLPGSDAWLSPPDPKTPPSGDTCIYVERGDDELEVVVEFDEGSVFAATVNGKPFELTKDEIQRAEEDWATREPEERDDEDRNSDR